MNASMGFCFSNSLREVALIKKATPSWQRGRLNGVGGKAEIKDGGNPFNTMRREFSEEAGLDIVDWRQFGVLVDELRGWEVALFRAQVTRDRLQHCHGQVSLTDGKSSNGIQLQERVQLVPVDAIPFLVAAGQAMHNLGWMIPMALNSSVKHKFGPSTGSLTRVVEG